MTMLITLDALQTLDAIERRQSFAAAAEELHRVPSAVSYTINKLEEDLGVELFDRSQSSRTAHQDPVGRDRDRLEQTVALNRGCERVEVAESSAVTPPNAD